MVRNSTLYRRLWYVRRRNAKWLQMYKYIFFFLAVLTIAILYIQYKVLPQLLDISEPKVRVQVAAMIESTVRDTFPNGVNYYDIVKVNRDRTDRISSILTDVVRLDVFSSQAASSIQEKLASSGCYTINISLGTLLGKPFLAAVGPDIHIQAIPAGNVHTEFKSEFSDIGANQIRHRIYLQVKTPFYISAPLIKKRLEVITDVPYAENVIVVSIPPAGNDHN